MDLVGHVHADTSVQLPGPDTRATPRPNGHCCAGLIRKMSYQSVAKNKKHRPEKSAPEIADYAATPRPNRPRRYRRPAQYLRAGTPDQANLDRLPEHPLARRETGAQVPSDNLADKPCILSKMPAWPTSHDGCAPTRTHTHHHGNTK